MLRYLLRDSRGATALEYGLILCLIVVVMVGGMTALGRATSSQWNLVASQVASAVGHAAS